MLLLEERRANGDTTRPPQAGVLLQKSSPLSEKHPKLGGTELGEYEAIWPDGPCWSAKRIEADEEDRG